MFTLVLALQSQCMFLVVLVSFSMPVVFFRFLLRVRVLPDIFVFSAVYTTCDNRYPYIQMYVDVCLSTHLPPPIKFHAKREIFGAIPRL